MHFINFINYLIVKLMGNKQLNAHELDEALSKIDIILLSHRHFFVQKQLHIHACDWPGRFRQGR
jgi:hypothetical protein